MAKLLTPPRAGGAHLHPRLFLLQARSSRPALRLRSRSHLVLAFSGTLAKPTEFGLSAGNHLRITQADRVSSWLSYGCRGCVDRPVSSMGAL